jgi:hypothetical protein
VNPDLPFWTVDVRRMEVRAADIQLSHKLNRQPDASRARPGHLPLTVAAIPQFGRRIV